jgi:hypothetical protein
VDTTASYSSRSNAKRAAEQMIANGTAPAIDYGFKARDDGRFEIVWQTAAAAPATGDADPFARIRAREEIEALGTTPEKYAFRSSRDRAAAAEAQEVHDAWQAERAAPNAATADEAGTEAALPPAPAPAATEAAQPGAAPPTRGGS